MFWKSEQFFFFYKKSVLVYCFISTYKWDINKFNNDIHNIDDNKLINERERARESDTGMRQRCQIKESSNRLYNWAIGI